MKIYNLGRLDYWITFDNCKEFYLKYNYNFNTSKMFIEGDYIKANHY